MTLRTQLSALALAIAFLDVWSARIDSRKEITAALFRKSAGYCKKEVNQNCDCFKQHTCSSCTLPACPLKEKAFRAESMAEGLTGTAWRLDQDAGPSLLVKFTGDYESSVVAAQIAHQLAVPTPRSLVVSEKDCPALFDAEYVNTLDPKFATDVTMSRRALVQEFVKRETDVLPGCDMKSAPPHRSRPWVRVGIIAMFDWLIGKPDLFIDWQESLQEDRPQNRHNIIADEGIGPIDIDIQLFHLTQSYITKDFMAILNALTAGDTNIPWVRLNVLDVLKENTFGKQAAVQAQVQLGLAYGLHDILDEADWLSTLLESKRRSTDVLERILEKCSKDEADGIVKQLSEKLDADLKAAAAKPLNCCKLDCGYRGTTMGIIPTDKKCSGGSHDGSFIIKQPMEGCPHYHSKLTQMAINYRCSPVCKAGKTLKVLGFSEVQMMSCE